MLAFVVSRLPRGGPRVSRFIGRTFPSDRVFSLNGFRMRLDTSDPNQAQMAFGTYQPEVISALKDLARPTDRVLVAGANVGYVPLALAALGCEVFAFEADPQNVSVCKANLALNPDLNVRLFDCGLSDEPAVIPMWQSDLGALSSFGAKHHAHKRIDVPVKRGDDLLDPIDGLLLDVEGWEVHALKGLRKTLSKARWAVIECAPWALEAAGSNETELHSLISELGFTVTENLNGDLVCVKDCRSR